MFVKIAHLEISTDEKLCGTLIRDLENLGYVVIENPFPSDDYVIARKSEQE